MNVILIKDDIENAQCDVIVNASNGVGYMGGKRSVKKKCRGVAESLNYFTKGKIEKEAMQKARRIPFVPSWICGVPKGDFFTTNPYGLNCKCVFHAVTMNQPGSRSTYKVVEKTLVCLGMFLSVNGYRTVALPLLGCGNGALNKNKILSMISEVAKEFSTIKFYVYFGTDN